MNTSSRVKMAAVVATETAVVVVATVDSARQSLEVVGSDSAEMVTAAAVTVQLPEAPAAETVDSAQRSAAEAAIESHTRRQL